MFLILCLLFCVPFAQAAAIPSNVESTNVEKAAATPTWVVRVLIGPGSLMIGDYDKHHLVHLMKKPCNSKKCDSDSPQKFQFNRTESGGIAGASATLTMDGSSNNNENMEKMLLSILNTTLLETSTCKKASAFYNSPDLLGVPGDTGSTIQLRQCHVAGYIQATLYSGLDFATSIMEAQMGMLGAPIDHGSWVCNEHRSDINTALGQLNLPSFIAGGVTIAKASCA